MIRRDFPPEAVLAKPLMADLATASPEGPRHSPLWFLWEDGAVWLIGRDGDSFLRRLAAEPRCALGVVDFDPLAGILLHVGIRGRATIGPMDESRFRRLLARYLGPDEAAWNLWFLREIARIDDPAGRMARLAPDTLVAKNVSFFRTGPALAVRPADP